MDRLKEKTIFNQDSREDHNHAKIIGGNPDGIMDFNKSNHTFFYKLYKQMLARTWFPEQVNISKDKINYSSLTEHEKRAYDLVLAQLIANDSIQSNQLVDRINAYITSPVVNAALIRQAWEECLTPEHEVYIKGKGWTRIEELEMPAKILCWYGSETPGRSTRTVEYLFVNRIVKKEVDEDIYYINNSRVSQAVTANHRLALYNRKTKQLEIHYAKDVYEKKMFNTHIIPFLKGDLSHDTIINKCHKETTHHLESNVENVKRYKLNIEKKHYKGMVYCPTVNSGLFFVRKDGKISITGNCNHSESYAVMAEDICQDTERIYYMHRYDEELGIKNKAVEHMYESLYTGNNPTKEDMLLAATANQILEGLVFLGGFVVMFSLERKMPGSSEMITEIKS